MLAFVMSQYDPHGMRAPMMLTAKLLLRKLYGSRYNGGWDDPLPRHLQLEWDVLMTTMLHMEDIRIPRAIYSTSAGDPWLVTFWDGSLDAHAVCIYLRMQKENQWGEQEAEARLLYAKSRVAPLEGTTIAKMELQGLVQATRSLLKIIRALDQKIERVVIAGDSLCTLMSVRREGAHFKPVH